MAYHSDDPIDAKTASAIFGITTSAIRWAKKRKQIAPVFRSKKGASRGRGDKDLFRYSDLATLFAKKGPGRCDRGHFNARTHPLQCAHEGTPHAQ